VPLLLMMKACDAPPPEPTRAGPARVDGLWTGEVRREPPSGAPPSAIAIQGSASALLLRHRGAGLDLLVEGSRDSDQTIVMAVNGTRIAIPVHDGRFREEIRFTEDQLGDAPWCRVTFSQPGVRITNFQSTESLTYPKTIVFALDGVTWRVLDRLIAQGRLPHFRRLARNGSSGILESVGAKQWSPVVWTTIASGKRATEHGILNFLDGEGRPVNSRQVMVERIWNILSDHSPYTLGVIGWYVTFPVEEIAGFMVSDRAFEYRRIHPSQRADLAYPPELLGDVQAVQTERAAHVVEESRRFTSYPFDPMFETKLAVGTPQRTAHELLRKRLHYVYVRDSTYAESGLTFYRALRPDVFFLYLRGADWNQHAYWAHMEPDTADPRPSKQDIDSFGGMIESYYVYLDEVMGRYMDAAPPDTTFLVISDHGFRPASPGEYTPEQQLTGNHEKQGVYLLQGPAIKANYRDDTLSVMDVTPMLLYQLGLKNAQDMPGRVPLDLRSESSPRQPELLLTYEGERKRTPRSVETGADEVTREHLRSLGYIGD
jgi:hypothetical protein